MIVIFATGVWSYRFVCDDAYISFVYARNLVEGHGLVFEPGVRVEGYTNLLWVLLTAAGMALGASPVPFTQIVGGACLLGVVLLLVDEGRRRHGLSSPWTWLPAFLLAIHSPFVAWATGGLETALFTLLVTAGLLVGLRPASLDGAAQLSSVLLGFAVLTRPDGVVFLGVLGAARLLRALAERTGGAFRRLALFCLPATLLVASVEIWRWAYYDDFLPNTFYAKVDGAGWSEGVAFLVTYVATYRTEVLVLLAGVAAWRGDERLRTVAAAVATWWLYVAWVGGDSLGYRFVVPSLPLLAVGAAEGLREMHQLLSRLTGRARAARVVTTLLAVLAAASMAGISGLQSEPRDDPVARPAQLDAYAALRAGQGSAWRQLVERGVIPAQWRVATGAVGAFPWECRCPILDLHGLVDREVAQLDLDARGFRSHARWAPLGMIRQRGVPVVDLDHVMIRPRDEELEPAIERKGFVAEWWNGGVERPEERLRVVCRRIGPSHVLLFGTNQPPGVIAEGLGHLPPCGAPFSAGGINTP